MERASKKTDDTTTSTDRWGPRRCGNKDTESGEALDADPKVRAHPRELELCDGSGAAGPVQRTGRVPRDLVAPAVTNAPRADQNSPLERNEGITRS